MAQILGNISSIETTGFVDGPGVRVVVFLQGCPLRCLYCHNPESLKFDTKKNIMTPQEVLEKVLRYKNYFGKNGGVTFSGGEPLFQQEFLLEVLKLCKQNNINTALDTAGSVLIKNNILEFVDTVILDIKAIDEQQYLKLTGNTMHNFNKFLQLCQKNQNKLWIRQVIVPGINDSEQYVLKLKEFISGLSNVQKIELLPYHDMAKEKYIKLGMEYALKDTLSMDKLKCKQLQMLMDS